MKHSFPFILCLFFATMARSQDTTRTKAPVPFARWQIGVGGSADHCYRTLSASGSDAFVSNVMDSRNDREEPTFGFSAGASARYDLTAHWGIELGAQYAKRGYASKPMELTFGDIIDPRYGFIYETPDGPRPSRIRYIYNYHYVDVPLQAVFHAGHGRFRFMAGVGIAANILLKATSTGIMDFSDGSTTRHTAEQIQDYKTFDLSPLISLGADRRIGQHLSVQVVPTFRYGVLKIIDAPITAYLWSAGVNVGCYYALK